MYGGGVRRRVYTYRYTVTTRMMGSDESHFNVSLIRLLPHSAGTSRIAITPRELALLAETFAVLQATVFGPLVAGVAGAID